MTRLVLSFTISLALLAGAFGHAVASHHGPASSAADDIAAIEHVMDVAHSGHDCDRSCDTADVIDCCGKTIAHCASTILGKVASADNVSQDASMAEFFADDPALSASGRAFDPPPPKT